MNTCGQNQVKLLLAIFLLLTGFAAFAANKSKPEWVATGKAGDYPDSQYIVGIGTAADTHNTSKDQTAADEAAKAKLAEQIQVSIQSDLDSYLSEQSTKVNKKTHHEVNQSIAWQIKSKVNIKLEGVQFPERYYDRGTKTYYSLAVLDRTNAASFILDQAADLRKNAGYNFGIAAKLEQKQDFLSALTYYQKALPPMINAVAKEREASVILAKNVSADSDSLNPWMIQVKIDDMKNKLTVGIHIIEMNPVQPGSNVVASLISQAFRARNVKLGTISPGFAGMTYEAINAIKPEDLSALLGESLSFLVLGQVEAEKSSEMPVGSDIFYFYKSRAQVKMFNIHTGEVIANISFDYEDATKAAKAQPAQAAAESLKKAGDILADQLVAAFQKYQTAMEKNQTTP